MKVLFYTNIPSPYRVDFFNELGKYCELTVLFERGASSERNDAWRQFEFQYFKGIIMKGKRTSVDSAFCPGIIRYLRKNVYDYIFISVLASLTAPLAVIVLKAKGIRYFYEGDGGFAGSVKGLKAFIKRFIISNAELCFSTSSEFDKYCIAYGAKKEHIVRYPFTSVWEKDVLSDDFSEIQKEELRKKFGITEPVAIISVGRMIKIKGFDLLLEIAINLPEKIGIYIVGDKPTEELLQYQKEHNLHHVHFMEFMSHEKLKQLYRAMDIFVLLTRGDSWGLVINEAMSNGLPVVSTDRCVAATELIKKDCNGIVVSTDKKDEIESALQYLCNHKEIREKMARNALLTIKNNYTIEAMAEAHIKLLNEYRRL